MNIISSPVIFSLRLRKKSLRQLEITTRRHGVVEVVTARGSIVLGEPVDSLDETVNNLLAHEVVRFVLVLSDVKRLDSSGIGFLVRVLQAAKERGGSVRLVQPSRQVSLALKMCQLLPLFEVFEQEADAIATFP